MNAPLLDERLRGLAASVADAMPPASVDRAIAAAIETAPRRSAADSARPFERWLVWPIALAASIFVISFVVREAPIEDLTPGIAPEALAAAAQAFVPVAPAEEIARATDAYVVAARLPRTALAQFGLPVNPERIADAVDAELLVRPDGAVLALRFFN